MAHEIDELAPGIHAAVFARQDAWHGLGITLDRDLSAEDVMTAGMLGGWNVRKLPLFYEDDAPAWDGARVENPDRWATVRTNPATQRTEYLGTVGSKYVPIQNEEHAGLLQAIVDESGAVFDTAGSLRGGKETFITMRMPEDLLVGGADPINLNLVALNSHDGMSAFRFLVSPVRVVCANTQSAAIRQAKASFSIRHTLNAGRELQEARDALGLTWKYVEAFEKAAEELIAAKYTNRQYDNFVARVLNIETKDKDKVAPQLEAHRQGMLQLWRDSDTLDGIRGTKWGAYQTVTEYFDHYAPTRGKDEASYARAFRAASSQSDVSRLKSNAFAHLVGAK